MVVLNLFFVYKEKMSLGFESSLIHKNAGKSISPLKTKSPKIAFKI